MIRKYKTWYRLLPLIGIGLIVCITTTVNAQSATQTTDRHTAEMGWWKKARFGMFIHWGLYSEAAGYWDGKPISGIGEWIMNDAQVPRHQYEKLATRFDPVDFKAAQWVKIAKEAGIKYLVITTKHHDGFCMFNTRATRYNVVGATPWHKDPMAALSRACSSQGIRFCTYYSVMDWHTKFQQAADTDAIHPTYNPTTLTHPAQYIHYMDHQLHELISQYHTNLIWFDGGWIKNWTSADALHVFKYIRSIDPTVIVNNRLGHHIGDYGTPEQQIPVQGLPGPWETCMTINDTWGYKRGDTSWKSASTLITNLIHCASGGGNFLLNVGPTGKGVIPKPEVDRLLAIGRWLKVNGKAIYGSHRTPFPAELSFGYATQKPGELFLEVTKWPANRELTVPMKNPILHAYLLANPHKELKTIQTPGGLNIQLPLTAPDEVASVVVLKIRGAVQGE